MLPPSCAVRRILRVVLPLDLIDIVLHHLHKAHLQCHYCGQGVLRIDRVMTVPPHESILSACVRHNYLIINEKHSLLPPSRESSCCLPVVFNGKIYESRPERYRMMRRYTMVGTRPVCDDCRFKVLRKLRRIFNVLKRVRRVQI